MSRPIGEVPTRTFQPGDVIFREGDDAKGEAFMVHMGRVEFRQRIGGEDRVLRTLSKGELFGHIALFRNNAARSATAIAVEAVTLMVISANRLDHLVRANPALAVALIRDLASMMLAAEDRLREAEDKLKKQQP
jgi:CRP-like cAMP-binding protein